MRHRLLLLAVLAGMAAFALPGQGLGGVAVQGMGSGTFVRGTQVCPGSPFTAQAVYLPDGNGSMHAEVASSCPVNAALAAMCCRLEVNSSQEPVFRFEFLCHGSEAAGLRCAAQLRNLTLLADVGPYAGPGSVVSLHLEGTFRFDGSFTAV